MGLDVTAYKKLTPAPNAKLDEHGWPDDDAHYRNFDSGTIDWTEGNWPGRTEGLKPGVYSFEDSHGFRAGSYGGYNQWRRWLAKVAGLGTPEEIWASDDPKGPFVELINFADNEGVIGPVVSAKLAKDFADNEDRISKLGYDYEIAKYREWRKAFEMAADGGCVDFH